MIYEFQSLRERLIKLIGTQGYEKIKQKFEHYLDMYEFEEAAKILPNVISNKYELEKVITHVLSYRVAC